MVCLQMRGASAQLAGRVPQQWRSSWNPNLPPGRERADHYARSKRKTNYGRFGRLFSCFELMSQIPTMQLENLIPHASVLVIVHSTEALLCRIVKSMSDLPVSKHHLG
jgi:hypothetical protein